MPLRFSARSALFLDRDGVLNRRLLGDYVTDPAQLELLPHVREVLAQLRPRFCRVVVVTNQQGVGKGLMTHGHLAQVHALMLQQLQGGGPLLIDRVYYCPALAAQASPLRKPAPGMAHQALADFPEIDLASSLMVGDTASDMEFGRRAGLQTLLFGQPPEGEPPAEWIDARAADWPAVAQLLLS
ncbi:MAG: HAD family hydrolase [Bernardetiaceae bacterium]|jgi:histidinol-phosphate phosphatase family protein|nr:HAD family hydrolase [Bernardetiaceae bacterium]